MTDVIVSEWIQSTHLHVTKIGAGVAQAPVKTECVFVVLGRAGQRRMSRPCILVSSLSFDGTQAVDDGEAGAYLP